MHYDVMVVGGGFAGVAAAVAAAEEGCRVLLLEKGNALGGATVNSLVNPFMPNRTRIDGVETPLSAGLFRRLSEELTARNAMFPSHGFLEEEVKFIFNDWVRAAGVDVLFRAYVSGVTVRDGVVESLTVASVSGEMTLSATTYIDATGDAQVTFLGGFPTVLGREPDHLCQPMTLCFRLGNVDVEAFMGSREALRIAHKQALDKGELLNPREDILVFRTPVPNVLHFNTTRVVKLDPTSVYDLSRAEMLARDQVREIYELMKRHAKGLENCFLMMTAPEIGVRESRMIVGDYVLTETDCRAFTRFEDSVAACNYDIDVHNPEGSGTSHYYFPEGEYYTIPYRALLPVGAQNLLVAGRCISSDHGAQASYRILPSVICIGEAAGVAAALAHAHACSPRAIPVAELQSLLRRRGAFLGI